jgi:hypothetical protein
MTISTINLKSLLSGTNGTSAIGQQNILNGTSNGNWVLSKNLLDTEYVKRYEIVELSEDLLALSVCWKRLRDSKQALGQISKLTDEELFRRVTTEDRDKAAKVRDYYSKKIMMLKLKSVELTTFRQDLNEFVHGDSFKIKEQMLPLAYRLPEFYEYDTEFENFASDYNKVISGRFASEPMSLSFIKKLTVNTRRQKRTEYWFSDVHNNLVLLSFDMNNPLLSMLDKQVKTEKIEILGHRGKRERDGQEYIKVDKFVFV